MQTLVLFVSKQNNFHSQTLMSKQIAVSIYLSTLKNNLGHSEVAKHLYDESGRILSEYPFNNIRFDIPNNLATSRFPQLSDEAAISCSTNFGKILTKTSFID